MKIGTTKHRQLTDQEVDGFVEEQRNPKTVKKTNSDDSKFIKFIQELPRLEEITRGGSPKKIG